MQDANLEQRQAVLLCLLPCLNVNTISQLRLRKAHRKTIATELAPCKASSAVSCLVKNKAEFDESSAAKPAGAPSVPGSCPERPDLLGSKIAKMREVIAVEMNCGITINKLWMPYKYNTSRDSVIQLQNVQLH